METWYLTLWPKQYTHIPLITTFPFEYWLMRDPVPREWGYRRPGIGQRSTLYWMRRMRGSRDWMWEDPNEDEWIPSYIGWDVPPPPIARPLPGSLSPPSVPESELEQKPATTLKESLSLTPAGGQDTSGPAAEEVAVNEPLYNGLPEADNVTFPWKDVVRE
ncbi:hypothetical protein GY45DRAFT_1318666 [Cubamyces sp. BRFM 1775]|nr:hypothetical protein GY45DRAFT_1318666 [Cubamyces sp. BRFM 1775]